MRWCLSEQQKVRYFSIYACHPCAGAMLIFSVSFQFLRMTTEVVPTRSRLCQLYIPSFGTPIDPLTALFCTFRFLLVPLEISSRWMMNRVVIKNFYLVKVKEAGFLWKSWIRWGKSRVRQRSEYWCFRLRFCSAERWGVLLVVLGLIVVQKRGRDRLNKISTAVRFELTRVSPIT